MNWRYERKEQRETMDCASSLLSPGDSGTILRTLLPELMIGRREALEIAPSREAFVPARSLP